MRDAVVDAMVSFILERLEGDETQECGHTTTMREMGMFSHVMSVFGKITAKDTPAGWVLFEMGSQLLRVLAATWSDHPDYQAEWKPLTDEALAAATESHS